MNIANAQKKNQTEDYQSIYIVVVNIKCVTKKS